MITWLLLILGLGLITGGAEWLVRGSSTLALRFGLSPLVVGLTVAAFGTSSPELVVSLKAGLGGFGDIAIGNVVGSNIFNVAVILGLTALIFPISVKMQLLKFDAPFMLGVCVLFALFVYDGTIGRIEAAVLLILLVVYLIFTVRASKAESGEIQDEYAEGVQKSLASTLAAFAWIILGLALLVYGGHLFVQAAIGLARGYGISEAVIGLTIVAAGTSMPELATSLVAALRKAPDIAIGNIIGSSIFNILCIIGATASIVPLQSVGVSMLDVGLMIGLAVLLLPFMRSGYVLHRWEGLVLLCIYGGYLWHLWPK